MPGSHGNELCTLGMDFLFYFLWPGSYGRGLYIGGVLHSADGSDEGHMVMGCTLFIYIDLGFVTVYQPKNKSNPFGTLQKRSLDEVSLLVGRLVEILKMEWRPL